MSTGVASRGPADEGGIAEHRYALHWGFCAVGDAVDRTYQSPDSCSGPNSGKDSASKQ